MAGPFDYSVNVESPLQAAAQGVQFGAGLADLELKRQQQQLALQQQARQQAFMQSFMSKPVKTAEDYSQATLMIPGLKDQFKQSWEMLNTGQQETAKKESGLIFSALNSGKTDVAKQLLQTKITALENSGGDPAEIRATKTMLQSIDIDPTMARDQAGLYLTSIPGGKDLIESYTKIGTEARAQQLQPAEIAKRVVEIAQTQAATKNVEGIIRERNAKLPLDLRNLELDILKKIKDLNEMDLKLPEGAQKLVTESATTAASSKQTANQLNDLASRLEKEGGGYGALASASEWLKGVGGIQGGMTQMRQEYVRLRNTAAIKSLPPGPATDRDIQLALKGFPPETADAGYIASFLRGMAKLQDIDAAVANAKTDWLAQNKGVLTRARTTFTAGDYAVKPGEAWSDFSERISKDIGQRYKTGGKPSYVEQIPTDKMPEPMAAQANVLQEADAILRGGR